MASANLTTENRVFTTTFVTSQGVDQVARDAVAAVRQVPPGGATGQVLEKTASGYVWAAKSAQDDTARTSATAAGNAATAAQAQADAAHARTVAKPYPWHQIIKWDPTRTGADKYDVRDKTTHQYGWYFGPTDPKTLRTTDELDLWGPLT